MEWSVPYMSVPYMHGVFPFLERFYMSVPYMERSLYECSLYGAFPI